MHTISPGMVFTELISSGRYAFGGQGRMFVNALAEDADDTAAVIVERVKEAIAAADAVEKTIAVKVLTPDVALKKMFNRFVRGVNKDRWYPEKDERDVSDEKTFRVPTGAASAETTEALAAEALLEAAAAAAKGKD